MKRRKEARKEERNERQEIERKRGESLSFKRTVRNSFPVNFSVNQQMKTEEEQEGTGKRKEEERNGIISEV